jgi:uncharacterized membrane protein HdeD (DUF308 family)
MDRHPALRDSVLAVYSVSLAGGNIFLGALVLIGGDPRMSAASFDNLRGVASPTAWGFMLVFAGCATICGQLFRYRPVVFWGHLLAGAVCLFWAAAFTVGANDSPTSPWTGIAAYLIIATQHWLTAGMQPTWRRRHYARR